MEMSDQVWCDKESVYKRLEAEYQTAVDAYRTILMYEKITTEVTGSKHDEFTKAVFQARRDMEKARGALNAYIRKIRSVNENVYERCYKGEW